MSTGRGMLLGYPNVIFHDHARMKVLVKLLLQCYVLSSITQVGSMDVRGHC